MLAQNFMTSNALGLSEVERGALITVLGMLERDELPHEKRGKFTNRNEDVEANPVAFNMSSVYGIAPCGTVCCIAGWAERIAHVRPFSLFERRRNNPGIEKLFDPYFGEEFSIRDITPAQAAIALRNFLMSGKPNWPDAIGRDVR